MKISINQVAVLLGTSLLLRAGWGNLVGGMSHKSIPMHLKRNCVGSMDRKKGGRGCEGIMKKEEKGNLVGMKK